MKIHVLKRGKDKISLERLYRNSSKALIEEVCKSSIALQEQENEVSQCGDREIDESSIEFHIKNSLNGKFIYAIKINDEIAGHAILYFTTKPECEISEFFLYKKFRSKGFGRFILTYLIDEYKKSGTTFTITVLTKNFRAYNLYLSLGFKVYSKMYLLDRLEKVNTNDNFSLIEKEFSSEEENLFREKVFESFHRRNRFFKIKRREATERELSSMYLKELQLNDKENSFLKLFFRGELKGLAVLSKIKPYYILREFFPISNEVDDDFLAEIFYSHIISYIEKTTNDKPFLLSHVHLLDREKISKEKALVKLGFHEEYFNMVNTK